MALQDAHLEWFVGYADVDSFGGVQWAAYAQWAARANSLVWKLNRSEPPDTGVVRSLSIDYLAPAALEDTLVVTARYTKAGRTSFECEVAFDRQDGTRAALATLRMVSIDPVTSRPTEVPDWLHVLRQPPSS